MGTWGAGLYSDDMALDLRSTIGALVRLPFDEPRIVEILCEGEEKAANDPQDEDHTTFWLVLADQFAKRGLMSSRVRDKALDIIDSERDLAMLAARGMTGAALRKRSATLQKLRAALFVSPRPARRATLKAPLPYTLEVGKLYACPVLAAPRSIPIADGGISTARPGSPTAIANSSCSHAARHSATCPGTSRSSRSRP
ncbi:MAG: hypothetical protein JO000_21115 [Alphaproteobacteria bacterium]|nr:hypothetical protein [Alphaproteobacteria bacterium]